MTKPRRRQAGEGTIAEYQTKAGPRYLIKYTATVGEGDELVRRVTLKRGFRTRRDAAEALRKALAELDAGTYIAPNTLTVGSFLDVWLDGLRLQPSTVASYRRLVRLHVVPYIGGVELRKITGARLAKLYRQLEHDGRADGQGGLSARTVRYLHTILHSAFKAAIADGLLGRNPADTGKPPSTKAAAAPEIRPWTSEELSAFLEWSGRQDDELHVGWVLLATTGMRRGEALALQWRDVDFEAGTVAVRRAVSVVKERGHGQRVHVTVPKSGKARVVELDPATLSLLRSWRARVGAINLTLAAPTGLVLGNLDGEMRHPEAFSRSFTRRVARAQRTLPDLTMIRLHDLRHTWATIAAKNGVNMKVIQERLGHSDVGITLRIYTHASPTMQREAANAVAALIFKGTA